MIKAVLFDFDGVMALDRTGTESICRYISKAAGIDLRRFETEYRKFNPDLLTGRTDHQKIWPDLCRFIGIDIPLNILHDSFINTPLDTEMISLVKRIKQSGCKTGLVTDNKKDRIDMITEHFKTDDYFDAKIVSAETGSGKDKPDIFNGILAALSVSASESVFIDNNRSNLEIPAEMGMKCIYFDHQARDIQKLISDLKAAGISENFL